MSFAPYIGFSGDARPTMIAYAALFGANDLQIMTFADAPPDQRPPGSDGLVMHAQFSIGPGAPLMGCDIPPGFGSGGMGGSSVFHAAATVPRAQKVFAALSDGGTVTLPMAPTFWSPAFGMVTDRFGTRWIIAAETPADEATT